jgi:hypothetical protein
LLARTAEVPAQTEWIFIARAAMKGRSCADVMAEMKWMVSKVHCG